MTAIMMYPIAKDKLGRGKFTADHLKVLRESKVILDDMTNQEFIQAKDARRLIIPSFQANGLEGEIKLTKLVAPGLYTVQHLGYTVPSQLLDQSLLYRCTRSALHCYTKNQKRIQKRITDQCHPVSDQ